MTSVADLPDDGTADQYADQPYTTSRVAVTKRNKTRSPAKLAFYFAANQTGIGEDFQHRVWRWWYLIGCGHSKLETTIGFERV